MHEVDVRLAGVTSPTGERRDALARESGAAPYLHEIARLPGYCDRGVLRTDYEDVEDCGQLHITLDDGAVADVFASGA